MAAAAATAAAPKNPVIHSSQSVQNERTDGRTGERQDNRKSKCCMTSSLTLSKGRRDETRETNEPRDNLNSAAPSAAETETETAAAADLFYVRTDIYARSLARSARPTALPYSSSSSAPSIPEGDVRFPSSPFPSRRPAAQPARCFKTCFGVKLHFHTRYLFRSRSLHTFLPSFLLYLPISCFFWLSLSGCTPSLCKCSGCE